jgi:acyl-CoA reductase-like NAD-dependent aldehyde dehydrogenase
MLLHSSSFSTCLDQGAASSLCQSRLVRQKKMSGEAYPTIPTSSFDELDETGIANLQHPGQDMWRSTVQRVRGRILSKGASLIRGYSAPDSLHR